MPLDVARRGTLDVKDPPLKAIVAANDNYEEGYHKGNAGGLDAIDTDLAAANIKNGITIFGKVGTAVGVPNATLADFQATPATGTMTNPDDVNDNNPALASSGNAIDKYAEIDYGELVAIDQWRFFGWDFANEDGFLKLQYKDSAGNWTDWKTGIPTRKNSWSSMASETEVITRYVRVVVTTVDSQGSSWVGELEVYHS